MGGIGLQYIVSLRGFEYTTTVTFKGFFVLYYMFLSQNNVSPQVV